MKRLVVLISGKGSNLQALMDHTAAGTLHAAITAVVSNRPDAYGLERARQAGIPTEVLSLSSFKKQGENRTAYNSALADLVAGYSADLVILAGWMLILESEFLNRFPGRVINLHPALPGAFPGTNAIARAHAAFHRGEIKHTGVMVHKVVPEVDAGPLVVSEPVPIFRGESVEDLEERIHFVEHNLIVAAVDLLLRLDS